MFEFGFKSRLFTKQHYHNCSLPLGLAQDLFPLVMPVSDISFTVEASYGQFAGSRHGWDWPLSRSEKRDLFEHSTREELIEEKELLCESMEGLIWQADRQEREILRLRRENGVVLRLCRELQNHQPTAAKTHFTIGDDEEDACSRDIENMYSALDGDVQDDGPLPRTPSKRTIDFSKLHYSINWFENHSL